MYAFCILVSVSYSCFLKSKSKFYVYTILIIIQHSGFIATFTRLTKNVESVSGAIRPFNPSFQIHINATEQGLQLLLPPRVPTTSSDVDFPDRF